MKANKEYIKQFVKDRNEALFNQNCCNAQQN